MLQELFFCLGDAKSYGSKKPKIEFLSIDELPHFLDQLSLRATLASFSWYELQLLLPFVWINARGPYQSLTPQAQGNRRAL